jgi:hypothetical protein
VRALAARLDLKAAVFDLNDSREGVMDFPKSILPHAVPAVLRPLPGAGARDLQRQQHEKRGQTRDVLG